jgi:hypothetical protein
LLLLVPVKNMWCYTTGICRCSLSMHTHKTSVMFFLGLWSGISYGLVRHFGILFITADKKSTWSGSQSQFIALTFCFLGSWFIIGIYFNGLLQLCVILMCLPVILSVCYPRIDLMGSVMFANAGHFQTPCVYTIWDTRGGMWQACANLMLVERKVCLTLHAGRIGADG